MARVERRNSRPRRRELVVFENRAQLLAHLNVAADLLESGSDGLGLRELAHDVDKELAVLEVLLERADPDAESDPVQAAWHQVAVARALLRASANPSSPTRVDVAALAREVVDERRPLHGGTMTVTGSPEAVVSGDAALLRRALVNLLDNAHRAAPRGAVTVQVRQAGAGAVVQVDDDGSGPAAHRGSGLGIPTVCRIAALHGGTTTIGSSALGGRSVRLELATGGVT